MDEMKVKSGLVFIGVLIDRGLGSINQALQSSLVAKQQPEVASSMLVLITTKTFPVAQYPVSVINSTPLYGK